MQLFEMAKGTFFLFSPRLIHLAAVKLNTWGSKIKNAKKKLFYFNSNQYLESAQPQVTTIVNLFKEEKKTLQTFVFKWHVQ